MEVNNKQTGVYTIDDEGLLMMIGKIAGIMINNSISYDKTMLNQHKLMKLIDVTTLFFL